MVGHTKVRWTEAADGLKTYVGVLKVRPCRSIGHMEFIVEENVGEVCAIDWRGVFRRKMGRQPLRVHANAGGFHCFWLAHQFTDHFTRFSYSD